MLVLALIPGRRFFGDLLVEDAKSHSWLCGVGGTWARSRVCEDCEGCVERASVCVDLMLCTSKWCSMMS